MKSRLPFFIYLFFTVTILLYAIVRILSVESGTSKLIIKSDGHPISEELRVLLVKNNQTKIVKEIQSKFPEIENVSIKNYQNGKVEISLKYKKIVAIWTDGKYFYPLSENGVPVMQPYENRPNKGLLFKGEIPKDITKIIALMNGIESNINYLEYIEKRRWNLIMNNGAKVMLPEENMESAILEFKELMGKQFTELDLRNLGRILGSGFKQ